MKVTSSWLSVGLFTLLATSQTCWASEMQDPSAVDMPVVNGMANLDGELDLLQVINQDDSSWGETKPVEVVKYPEGSALEEIRQIASSLPLHDPSYQAKLLDKKPTKEEHFVLNFEDGDYQPRLYGNIKLREREQQ